MNSDQIKGNWTQLRGRIKTQGGRLTDDELDVIEGQRDVLAGKIQEAYGISKDEAERQVKAWEAGLPDDYGADDRTRRRAG